MSGPYECETWPKCSHPCLRDGKVIVSAERLAALVAVAEAAEYKQGWHDGEYHGSACHAWDPGLADALDALKAVLA